MKISTSMVKKIRITELEKLDPLTVIVENFGKGSGKIIIECFGESWSHFWSHMGEQYTLETFFCKASDDYLAGKLCRGREDEPDWDGMPKHLRGEIVRMRREGEMSKREAREQYDEAGSINSEFEVQSNSDLLSLVLGDDWMRCIPDRPTREYKYLCKIIPVVKDAFHSLSQAVAA